MLKLKISDIFELEDAFDGLIEQRLKYPINTAFHIYKFHEKLYEITRFVLERIEMVFGEGFDDTKRELSEQEIVIYNAIMGEIIEIEEPKFSIEDLLQSDNVELTIKEVKIIDQKLFIKLSDV